MVKATAAAAQAEKYLGNPYRGEGGMDCQAFVERCLADAGVKKDWTGSNAMARDMAWIGTPEECKAKFGRIPVGAFLFIWYGVGGEPEKYKADGKGDYGHVGLKIGVGEHGAIHSSSSKGQVVYSRFDDKTMHTGSWNRVGLCKLLDYELNEETKKEAPMEAMANAMVVAENGSPVNFRKEAKPGSGTWGALPVGTQVEVYGTAGDYYQIRYGGHEGYIMRRFVQVNGKMDDIAQHVDVVQTANQNNLVTQVNLLKQQMSSLMDRFDRLEKEWEAKMGWG